MIIKECQFSGTKEKLQPKKNFFFHSRLRPRGFEGASHCNAIFDSWVGRQTSGSDLCCPHWLWPPDRLLLARQSHVTCALPTGPPPSPCSPLYHGCALSNMLLLPVWPGLQALIMTISSPLIFEIFPTSILSQGKYLHMYPSKSGLVLPLSGNHVAVTCLSTDLTPNPPTLVTDGFSIDLRTGGPPFSFGIMLPWWCWPQGIGSARTLGFSTPHHPLISYTIISMSYYMNRL